MHKKLNALIALALILATLVFTWVMDDHRAPIMATATKPVTSAEPSQTQETLPVGLILKDRESKSYSLADFDDKVILLNFWATWCTPCIAEFGQFVNLARQMPDDLVILAVSIDDKKERIEPFLRKYVKEYGSIPNLYILWDEDKSVSQDMFQTIRVPETLVITPDKKIARKIAGLSLKWDSEETIHYLTGIKSN